MQVKCDLQSAELMKSPEERLRTACCLVRDLEVLREVCLHPIHCPRFEAEGGALISDNMSDWSHHKDH